MSMDHATDRRGSVRHPIFIVGASPGGKNMLFANVNPSPGGQEPARNEQIAVGTSAVTLCYPRTTSTPRKNILVRNISPNAADIITLNVGITPAVANAGIILRQYETWSDSSDVGYDCVQGTITAICATANGQVSLYER